MKIVIFSDTHLTKKFEERKFLFLKHIILDADQVIINGDFWEGKQITFEEFVNSPWKELFPYLKKKRTIYVYGNHDPKKWSDQRVSLFSTKQIETYVFKSGNKTFVVEHGHRFNLSVLAISRQIGRIGYFFTHKKDILQELGLERRLFKLFGKEAMQKKFRKLNNTIKNQMSKEFISNRILICSHTHAQESDLRHNFVDTGMIQYGIGQYIMIMDGEIKLMDKQY
jgi:predicted phosphodiesterase